MIKYCNIFQVIPPPMHYKEARYRWFFGIDIKIVFSHDNFYAIKDTVGRYLYHDNVWRFLSENEEGFTGALYDGLVAAFTAAVDGVYRTIDQKRQELSSVNDHEEWMMKTEILNEAEGHCRELRSDLYCFERQPVEYKIAEPCHFLSSIASNFKTLLG